MNKSQENCSDIVLLMYRLLGLPRNRSEIDWSNRKARPQINFIQNLLVQIFLYKRVYWEKSLQKNRKVRIIFFMR